MTKWIRHWWPTILMMALIFVASGTSGRSLPGFGHWDAIVKKGGHLTGYALLAIALLHGLAGGKPASSRHQAVLAVILAALYAVTDEFHQRFTPGRSPSITDVAIDTLGATIGLLVWARLRRASAPPVRRHGEVPQQ
jgi:VanZ family protein